VRKLEEAEGFAGGEDCGGDDVEFAVALRRYATKLSECPGW